MGVTRELGLEIYLADDKRKTDFSLLSMKVIRGVLIERKANSGKYTQSMSIDGGTVMYRKAREEKDLTVKKEDKETGEHAAITQLTL